MLLLVVALPLAAALLLTLLAARTSTAGSRDVAVGIALAATLGAAAALTALAPGVLAGEIPAMATPWRAAELAGALASARLKSACNSARIVL